MQSKEGRRWRDEEGDALNGRGPEDEPFKDSDGEIDSRQRRRMQREGPWRERSRAGNAKRKRVFFSFFWAMMMVPDLEIICAGIKVEFGI